MLFQEEPKEIRRHQMDPEGTKEYSLETSSESKTSSALSL
jgi:hypothetical protein